MHIINDMYDFINKTSSRQLLSKGAVESKRNTGLKKTLSNALLNMNKPKTCCL